MLASSNHVCPAHRCHQEAHTRILSCSALHSSGHAPHFAAMMTVPRSNLVASSCVALLLALILAACATAIDIPNPNPSPLPECATAVSRRFRWVNARAASFTNPALCTIGALPYPPTTFASGTDASGQTAASYTIVRPTETPNPGVPTSQTPFTPITTGVPTVIVPSSSTTSASTTNTTSTSSTSTSASAGTNTGSGVRRAAPARPAGFKSVQGLSGLQISLALFLGLGTLAAITYFLDELLDVLV
ncbi:hypothetical protein V8E36_001174 [Tilletia maclaganii]